MASYNYDYISLLEYNTETGLYDFTVTTFSGKVDRAQIGFFLTERRHEGKMHLLSYDLYKKPDYVGGLCMLNNILNPYSITADTVYLYLPEQAMQALTEVPAAVKYGESGLSSAKSKLISSLKKKKPDFIKNSFNAKRGNDQLPPTVLESDSPVIEMDGNKIQFAKGLFEQPQPSEGSADITEPIPAAGKATADYKRILVDRYIKTSGNT